MASKPSCFPTQKLYDEWAHVARIAGEECTPCTDCSPRYRDAMGPERCLPQWTKISFHVPQRASKHPQSQGETT